jgi:hypothetical protein
VVDLRTISEIIEYDDHILLVFSPDDDPPIRKLTGADAKEMQKWLDEDWQHYLAYLDSQNARPRVSRQRPVASPEPELPEVHTEPPF